MIPFVQTGACPFFEGRLLLYIPHKRRKNDLIKLLDDLKKEVKT